MRNEADRKLFFTVHFIVPAVMTCLLCVGSVMRIMHFHINDFDYGNYLNLVWNIANGYGWNTSLYRDIFGFSFLGDHLVFGAAFLAPLIRIFESIYLLSIVHSLALGACLFLVPCLARIILPSEGVREYLRPALFVCALLFVSQSFLAPWRHQAHMGTIFSPFLLLAIIALHKEKMPLLIFSCLMLLLAQERSSISLFAVGMYAFLLRKRHALGILLCLVSLIYFFLAVKVIIPWFQGGAAAYMYSNLINPLFELDKKALFVFMLLLNAAFLPLAGKRAALTALCALPMLGMALVSARTSMYELKYHYTDTIVLILAVSCLYGTAHIIKLWGDKPGFGRKAFVAACCVLLLLGTASRTFSPVYSITMLASPEEKRMYAHMRELIKPFTRLPDDISVFTIKGLGPYFALHPQRREITPQRAAWEMRGAVVVVSSRVDRWGTDLRGIWRELERNASLEAVLREPGLTVFASRDVAGRLRAIVSKPH